MWLRILLQVRVGAKGTFVWVCSHVVVCSVHASPACFTILGIILETLLVLLTALLLDEALDSDVLASHACLLYDCSHLLIQYINTVTLRWARPREWAFGREQRWRRLPANPETIPFFLLLSYPWFLTTSSNSGKWVAVSRQQICWCFSPYGSCLS